MKRVFVTAGMLLVSACAYAGQEMPPVPAAPAGARPATMDAQTLPEVVPPPASLPSVHYVCSDGTSVDAVERPAAGVLNITRLGETFALFRAVGEDPPRFIARDGTVYVTGQEAVITKPKFQPVRCQQAPAQPTAGIVHGTVTKFDRMALPAGTKVKILLVDVSRADAPAVEIASKEIVTAGNQVPFDFLMNYDPNRIDAAGRARYALQARITDGSGRLIYISDTHIPMFADGPVPQQDVEIRVVPAASR